MTRQEMHAELDRILVEAVRGESKQAQAKVAMAVKKLEQASAIFEDAEKAKGEVKQKMMGVEKRVTEIKIECDRLKKLVNVRDRTIEKMGATIRELTAQVEGKVAPVL
jgi:chromosome segregation ATPase